MFFLFLFLRVIKEKSITNMNKQILVKYHWVRLYENYGLFASHHLRALYFVKILERWLLRCEKLS